MTGLLYFWSGKLPFRTGIIRRQSHEVIGEQSPRKSDHPVQVPSDGNELELASENRIKDSGTGAEWAKGRMREDEFQEVSHSQIIKWTMAVIVRTVTGS